MRLKNKLKDTCTDKDFAETMAVKSFKMLLMKLMS